MLKRSILISIFVTILILSTISLAIIPLNVLMASWNYFWLISIPFCIFGITISYIHLQSIEEIETVEEKIIPYKKEKFLRLVK